MRDLVQCRLCPELRNTEQNFSEKDTCAAQCRGLCTSESSYFESRLGIKLYL